jgi:hypothetical protein
MADILENVRIFSGGCDLTGYSNKIDIAAEVEEKDATTFASVDANGKLWKEVKGGLAGGAIGGGGNWQAGDTSMVDDDAWAALGGAGAWTTFPYSLTAAAGDVAYFANLLRAKYQLLGTVGDIAPWVLTGPATGPVLRGVGLHPPGTARTATGTGTAVQHVAVASGHGLYAALHVLSVSGTSTPTITVAIESDVDANFDGSQTTRLTFTAATARGGQFQRVAGPITDTYYRAKWTITGTGPSFLFCAVLGVF